MAKGRSEERVQKSFKLKRSTIELLDRVAAERMIGAALIVERAVDEFVGKLPTLDMPVQPELTVTETVSPLMAEKSIAERE